MDRKSFFKNALLTLGASVVPNAILRGIRIYNPVPSASCEISEIDPPVGLFTQIDKDKFYWAPLDVDQYYERQLKAVKEGDFIRNPDGTITFYAELYQPNQNG